MKFPRTDGFIASHPTGSRYICDPPIMDTDDDHVVLVEDMEVYGTGLESSGWTVNRHDPAYRADLADEIEFVTARKGDVNLIIYQNVIGFSLFIDATHLAKQLNLKRKADRVALFQLALSGRRCCKDCVDAD